MGLNPQPIVTMATVMGLIAHASVYKSIGEHSGVKKAILGREGRGGDSRGFRTRGFRTGGARVEDAFGRVSVKAQRREGPVSNPFDDMEYDVFEVNDGRDSLGESPEEPDTHQNIDDPNDVKIGFHYDVGLHRRWGVQPRVDTMNAVAALRKGQLPANASRRAIFKQTPVEDDTIEWIQKLRLCEKPKRANKRSDPSFPVLASYPFYQPISRQMERFIGTTRERRLKFTAAAKIWESMPPPNPKVVEIAFAGRSNAGKSALVNAISLTRVARSADTPGFTRSINFYALRKPERLHIVDLPGYGFAHAGEDEVRSWNILIDRYLTERELARVFVVVDARHGIKQSDREMMDMLATYGKQFQVIIAKTDLVTYRELAQRWWHVNEELKGWEEAIPQVLMLSAKTGAGVCSLTTVLMDLTEEKYKEVKGLEG